MDPTRFDTLTRYLGALASPRPGPVSRRRGLALLLAGLAGLVAFPTAAAKPCLKTGSRCGRHSGGEGDPCRRCCSGFSKQRTSSKGRRCTCVPSRKRCRQSHQCCGALRCAAGRCGLPTVPTCGTGGPCTVFLREAGIPGSAIGGLDGADALCQASATAVGSLAPPGTYRAWLSDGTGSPATRFRRSPGPYVRVDGVEVAANWDDLTGGRLAAPITHTETGANHDTWAWTNTEPTGWPIAGNGSGSCGAWDVDGGSGWVGASVETATAWTMRHTTSCTTLPGLYCFQQD